MGTKLSNLLLAALLVVVLSAAAIAQPPRLINFQGRVLDAGAPVADGNHSFDFRIYDASAGGTVMWSELSVIIATTDGLLTYALGTSSAIPTGMFASNPALHLAVTVDGQVQTPRSRLITVPYAQTSEELNGLSAIYNGPAFKTLPSTHGFETYGFDGLRQFQIHGNNWSQLQMHDAQLINRMTVEINANSNSGGQLSLFDGSGANTIDLHGGETGNTSVEFPTDAIYNDEILDEPGVANKVRSLTFFQLDAITFFAVDSVDITIPAAGFVELTGGCYLNMFHDNGTLTELWVGISKSDSSFVFSSTPGVQVASVPSVSTTAAYQMPCTTTRLFSESAGTHRYYLLVRRQSGTNISNVAMIYLRAKYFPTAYGSIVLSKSDNGSDEPWSSLVPTDGSQQYENLNLRVQTLEEINAKLEAEREALRAENQRLRDELPGPNNQTPTDNQ